MLVKRIFSLLVFLNFFLSIVLAANCKTGDYKILGPSFGKVSQANTYRLNVDVNKVSRYIIKNNKIVVSYQGKNFSYVFKNPGNITIKSDFVLSGCNYSVKKRVSIYRTIILYIGDNKNIIPAFNMGNKNILFTGLTLKEYDRRLVKKADYIFVSQEELMDFFSKVDKSLLSNKKIVLLISSLKGFYSKLIIPYIKDLENTKVYIYDKKDFLNIVYDIYQGKKLSDANLVSIQNNSKTYLPLSYFVSKLIQQGVDINIIGLVLVAVFGTILIAFFRQIIGFSVFGVYTPLIFSILIVMFGWKLTLLLFLLSILANLVTYLITKKIYILYSSKISLNYIIYTILSVISIGLLTSYKYIDLHSINYGTVLLFFILPMISKNLIKEDTKIFSKSFLLFITEFFLITFALLLLFHFTLLKYILVSYPDLLWVCALVVILIGRFTGLQLLEYIRFAPLIKKNLYEEE